MVNAVMYSYKNKNLPLVVDNLFDASGQDQIHLSIIDQHQLNRSQKFEKYHNLFYEHVFWDKLNSPCLRKRGVLFNENITSEYILIISDDIMLSKGWLTRVSDFMKSNPKSIISGFGAGKVRVHDKYYLKKEMVDSDTFTDTRYIDSKFIFAKAETLRALEYPIDVKYHGESEWLSLQAYLKNIQVFSAPTNILFKDLGERTVETLYTTFSIEHKYNEVIESLRKDAPKWFVENDIDPSLLKKLPYQVNDVPYDPYDLDMVTITQDRFIASTKAIY